MNVVSLVFPGVKVRNLLNINEPASSVTRQPVENTNEALVGKEVVEKESQL